MHGVPLGDVAFAFANPSLAGDTLLVPAQTGNVMIRVVSVLVIMSGGVTIKFVGSANGDLTAAFPVLANGGFVLPGNEYGWFQTGPNESLSINLGSAVSGGVQLGWVPIRAAL